MDTTPLEAGQVRVLHPSPLVPHAEPLTVLVLDSPTQADLPDDVTALPGPCRIVHVVAVCSETHLATIADVLIDPLASGLPGHPFIMLDTVSTVRLDLEGDFDRFGPVLGAPLPQAACELAFAVLNQDVTALTSAADDPALAGQGWQQGTRGFVEGDDAWTLRVDTVRALNLLVGW